MFKINRNQVRIAGLLLATAALSCGALQGAAPARAGAPANGANDIRLTEFDANDTATDSASGLAGLLGGEYPLAPSDMTHGSGFPAGDSIADSISTPAFAP